MLPQSALTSCACCVLLSIGSSAWASEWDVPAEGACKTEPPQVFSGDDALPFTPAPGDVVTHETSEKLKGLLPPELWEHRKRFFYSGMQMEIGPCYRDYAPPAFFQQASKELSADVRLDDDGTLSGYRAGLPFPADQLRSDDPRAAQRWAWNWTKRYTAAGAFGDHLLSIVNDQGVADQWRGDHFYVRIRGRADRPQDEYVYPAKVEAAWAAGGSTKNLKTGNVCVFREYASGKRRPDFFAGSSYTRKIRRETAPDSETHLTACLVDAAIGAGLFVHGGEAHLHNWKVRGVVDLLAPINSSRDTWPVDKSRGYGPWGISFASDRWELRRVIVLEGELREGEFEDRTRRFVWYLDLQTLAPLYYAGYRQNGDVAGIGYNVWRWSEDRPDYPRWPDAPDRPMRVLDLVGAAFVDWNDQHAVRIESGNQRALPPSDKKLRRSLSVSSARIR